MAVLPDNVEPPRVEVPTTPPPSPRRFRPWLVLFTVVVLAVAGWLGGRTLWANARWRAAERAIARYEFAEALAEFERYLSIWPNSVPARFQAARAARRAERYEQFQEHLAAAEAAGVTPETSLENILLRAQQGDLQDVEAPLQALIRDGHPETILIAEALVLGYLHVFRLPDAEAVLTVLIRHAPDDAAAYFRRAGLLEVGLRSSDALEDFRRAVQLVPDRTEYRLRLAGVLVAHARANEAWPHFQRLLRESPSDPVVLLGTARCLRALAQPSRAVDHLETLLRDHPDHAEGWAERGFVHGDLGEDEASLRCLRKSFTLEPGNSSLGLALYAELQAHGHVREANAVWKTLEATKKDDQRLIEVAELLGKTPRNAPLRYEMGLICLRNKAEMAALRWFTGAIQDDPGHRPSHRALADFYERKGDHALAEFHRERGGSSGP